MPECRWLQLLSPAAAAAPTWQPDTAVAELRLAHVNSPTASYVSSSGGIAVHLRSRDSSAQQLITDADRNLFQAKHQGRNRMVAVDAKAA